MFTFSSLQRRVSISHAHGKLHVRVELHNQATTNRIILVVSSAVFVWFLFLFFKPVLQRGFSRDALIIIPFLGFLAVWFTLAVRIFGWRSFGIEELSADRNILEWRRSALWWVRTWTAPAADIADVRAVVGWSGLNNRVEFTCRGRHHQIGDMLLREETIELAAALRRALNLRS